MASLGLLLAVAVLSPGHAHPAPKPARVDFLRANMDFSVNPGVDFFTYANGAWLKKNPIPASESTWGIGNVVREEIYTHLRKIDEAAAKKNARQGSDEQKVGDFWATAIDEAKAESLGLTPLKPQMDKIDAIGSAQDALKVAFEMQEYGIGPFFGFGVSQDEKKSDEMAVHIGQGGLGLPDRDFYFNSDAGVVKIRDEYVKYLQNLLQLAGRSDVEQSAKDIMAFETELAKVSRKLEDLRDPEHNYNKMPIGQVEKTLTPSIVWHEYFDGWHLKPKTIIVGQPEFFTGLESLLAKTPMPVLQDYLRVQLINAYAPYLNKEADALDFHFNHEVLNGQKKPRPRWKRVLDAENGAIGFILGRIFVKEYFPPSAKKRYADLVEAFRTAYGRRIDRLDWMSPATKAKAHQKLAAVVKKVGFPDKWKDYSTLKVDRSSFCQNMMSASRWSFMDSIHKFGKPVDRTEWGMTPQTYNAYYNPSNNEIVLPAAAFAIPGLKPSDIDDAVLYGYAGASTIGHEMTHGFDDEGRQFDAKGNLKEWWTKEDAKKFQARAEVMVKQFDAYFPLPGIHINGKASLGENIADYGGLLIGVDAFKKTEQYKSGRKIAGLTPMQRFFLGYALSWMVQYREQLMRRALLSDVHSPPKWRVVGPLSNMPDFYKAFNVTPGQPMRRADKDHVRIW